MHIVFCADRRVLPGLHVAAYSLVDRFDSSSDQPIITVFSDALDDDDIALLDQTLARANNPYSLHLHRIDSSKFSDFPPLNGSWATYYRLYAAQTMEVDRFLYVDADTLCDVDVSELRCMDMADKPAAWVPEAPLKEAVDYEVAEQLKGNSDDVYFNAGVILINTLPWRKQQISERAMDYIAKKRPIFHDQSALNVLLYDQALKLDSKFNCMSNMRKNWPFIKHTYGKNNRLIHFLDYPKPWDLSAEWVHPQYELWRTVLNKTALQDFRSWHQTAARKLPNSKKAWHGYQKSIKDRLLFSFYRRSWLTNVKGI
ncbi:MAG: glycosyltransferase family 8 protein [Cyanobacteria bacterium P01_A01_bin.116]